MNSQNGGYGAQEVGTPDTNAPDFGNSSDHLERAAERSVPLRPGVTLPDWSLVREEPARAALAAIVDLIGVGTPKWSPLAATEDQVWRCVLEQFAAFARAPSLGEIADTTGLAPDAVVEELKRLRARDVVVLDDDGRITGAYPFTERSTGHRVVLRGKTLSAMCAIDALGVGAMFGAHTEIESLCRFCGTPIRVKTGDSGIVISDIAPEGAVVWIGYYYADGCAATSTCTVLAFFCSDDHLAAWRAGEGAGRSGVRLSVDTALQVGKAIFVPILQPRFERDSPP